VTTELTQIANVKVGAPFSKANLTEWLAVVPEHAAISVTTHEGGSQRDPYPVAFTFHAKWTSTNN
jgi:hypothetical protein